jgi:GNAT superfamily N-acetyltransferase
VAPRVEEIDARTAPDEALSRFAEVERACSPETNPGEPPRGVDEVIAFHRHQPTSHTSCHWLADGGTAALYVHGPTAAFVHVLVAPGARGRGVGSALLAAAVERSRELGVRALHGHHTTPAGAAFAGRFGFTDGQRVVRSLLDLRAADLPDPAPPDGWRLVTWLRRVPDEHLAAFVRARASMDDAPAPDELEFPTATAEQVRASEESLLRREREARVTVALRDDGEIGAFTELRVSRGSTLGFTDDTGTVAAQRGRGLARAVKAESLRRLRDDHPEIDVVTTSNAEENAVMRHLNETLGFRPSAVEVTATLGL